MGQRGSAGGLGVGVAMRCIACSFLWQSNGETRTQPWKPQPNTIKRYTSPWRHQVIRATSRVTKQKYQNQVLGNSNETTARAASLVGIVSEDVGTVEDISKVLPAVDVPAW